MKALLVPVLMLLSSALMALAWLGHLRYREGIGFWTALAASWLLVRATRCLKSCRRRGCYQDGGYYSDS